MFTVCPKCTLTLAVTAGDLRVGQGYVRCGRCSNVFNALLKLSDAPAEGAAADLPELPQADPASTSQIHRAITAAAIDGGAAHAAAAAAAAARPAPPPTRPSLDRRSPAPASPAVPAAPATPAPDAGPPAPAPSLPRAPTAAPAPAAPAPAPAPAAPAARTSAPIRSAPAATAPEPQPAPAPSLAQALRKPAVTAPAGAAPVQRPAAMASAQPVPPAPAAGTPATRPAARRPDPMGAAALTDEPSGKESNADAIDQFELVLQTLGLNPDGEESSLLLADSDELEPTQTVENIVLEGDEVRQTEARVPGTPLDELDLFTRRLGVPTGADAATPAQPPAQGVAAGTGNASRGAGLLAARRARLALAARRSAGGAEASVAAARAAGRDPGVAVGEPSELEGVDGAALAAGPTDLDIPGLRADTPLQTRLWLGGCIALAVLLIAQFINHWRDALAASPTWGHPITGLYAALGAPLRPQWDLSAYEVHQQGAESAGGPHAAIRVRFSLANHAMRAQPVPLLRLTLLDRYGRRVAERTLTPADYWPKGRSAENFLAADERVDTEVQVRDPSADSASFELDVCLPDAPGSGVHCAGDAGAAGAAGAGP